MTRVMEAVIGDKILDTITLASNGRVTYSTGKAKSMIQAVKTRNQGTVEQAFLELWNSSNGYIAFKGVKS